MSWPLTCRPTNVFGSLFTTLMTSTPNLKNRSADSLPPSRGPAPYSERVSRTSSHSSGDQLPSSMPSPILHFALLTLHFTLELESGINALKIDEPSSADTFLP